MLKEKQRKDEGRRHSIKYYHREGFIEDAIHLALFWALEKYIPTLLERTALPEEMELIWRDKPLVYKLKGDNVVDAPLAYEAVWGEKVIGKIAFTLALVEGLERPLVVIATFQGKGKEGKGIFNKARAFLRKLKEYGDVWMVNPDWNYHVSPRHGLDVGKPVGEAVRNIYRQFFHGEEWKPTIALEMNGYFSRLITLHTSLFPWEEVVEIMEEIYRKETGERPPGAVVEQEINYIKERARGLWLPYGKLTL